MTKAPAAFGRDAAAAELRRIVDWWLERAPDYKHGGFVGEIDHRGKQVPGAAKGIILNSRLLWFFGEVARLHDDDRCRAAGQRAWDYLDRYFDDKPNGGAAWQLAADGALQDGKKQIYAQCFCVYAFCAWYGASGKPEALDRALAYVDLIEKYAKDDKDGGYFEAFSQDWSRRVDTPLGPADTDVPKTMNTHLHLLEAYTTVHRVAPSETSEQRLRDAIFLMRERILDRDKGHLRLYFDRDWSPLGDVVSYGHDIEASWLLWEAGEILGDHALLDDMRADVLALAATSLDEGIGDAGHLCNEFEPATGHRDQDAIWWVQAEALVGFLNAYAISGDSRYRQACDGVWEFICRYQADYVAGDWHWFSTLHTPANSPPYKVGFWKAPYHNGRAMLESLRLIDRIDAGWRSDSPRVFR